MEAIARQTEPLWAMLSDTIGRIEAGLATVAPHWDAAAALRVLPPGAAQVCPAPGLDPEPGCVLAPAAAASLWEAGGLARAAARHCPVGLPNHQPRQMIAEPPYRYA